MTWHDLAACRGHEETFADADIERHHAHSRAHREAVAKARAICAECPVAAECLKLALAKEGNEHYTFRYSVYAGLTPMERARLANVRHSGPKGRPTIEHGTSRGANAHRYRGEPPCDDCRAADNAARRARKEKAS